MINWKPLTLQLIGNDGNALNECFQKCLKNAKNLLCGYQSPDVKDLIAQGKFDCPNSIDAWINSFMVTLRVNSRTKYYNFYLTRLADLIRYASEELAVENALKAYSDDLCRALYGKFKDVTILTTQDTKIFCFNAIKESMAQSDANYKIYVRKRIADSLNKFNCDEDTNYDPFEKASDRTSGNPFGIRPIVKIAGMASRLDKDRGVSKSPVEQVKNFWDQIKNAKIDHSKMDLFQVLNSSTDVFYLISRYIDLSQNHGTEFNEKCLSKPTNISVIETFKIDDAHDKVFRGSTC